MTEYKNLSYGESFKYKGLIDFKSLYRLIDKWFKQRDYDKVEFFNFEETYETGKQITLELRPYKKLSDYVKIEIRLKIVLEKLKETIIEQEGIKTSLMKGQGTFTFETFLITDYEGHWSTRPFYFFTKTLMDKFIYRSYTERYEDTLIKDKDKIRREIKSFLNMTRFGDV